ncbi:hypothetical protein [Rhizobium leguminosarum]
MLKRILAKWKLGEEALDGIDDLRGDRLVNLEKRVLPLEREMTKVQEHWRKESDIEQALSLDNFRN